jgi:serine/threonine protein kinase
VIRYIPAEVDTEQETTLAISHGRHPNIIEVIDTWVERERNFTTCFIRMELCDGDLDGYIHSRYQAKQVFFEKEIWDIFAQLMAGIEYIHSRGYVHKDIKPKNRTPSN